MNFFFKPSLVTSYYPPDPNPWIQAQNSPTAQPSRNDCFGSQRGNVLVPAEAQAFLSGPHKWSGTVTFSK